MSKGHGSPVNHTHILAGLVAGAVIGCLINYFAVGKGEPPVWLSFIVRNFTEPVGKVFLNLLMMTVMPLVFASLAVGVAQLGGLGHLGRLGAKTFGFFFVTSGVAVCIGLILVNTIKPGKGMPEDQVVELKKQFAAEVPAEKTKPAEFGVATFVNMIPRNPIQAAAEMNMIGVIVFALLIGIGISSLDKEKADLVINGLSAVGELMVFIIGLAMKIAPYGVFCLIFTTTAKFGFQVLFQLGYYVGVVLIGLGLQLFVTYPILLSVFARYSPRKFFSQVRFVTITAFSTSSSSATLPTSLQVAQTNLGIPSKIASFVLPLGATMNMNGTALFEGITVMFLAQVMGADLNLGQQFIVVVLSVITAVGAAGVPGGSIPLMAMVLAAVNVPPESIVLVLGVDRILDMCRTVVNVLGDLTATVLVARSEGMIENGDGDGENGNGSAETSEKPTVDKMQEAVAAKPSQT